MPITYLQCDFTVRDLRAAGECQILLIHNKLKILLTITGSVLNFQDKQRRSIKVRIRNNAKRGIFNMTLILYVLHMFLWQKQQTDISVYLWGSQPAVHGSVHATTHRQDNIYINAHNEESKFCPDAIRNMCCGEYNKQIYTQVTYAMMWRWAKKTSFHHLNQTYEFRFYFTKLAIFCDWTLTPACLWYPSVCLNPIILTGLVMRRCSENQCLTAHVFEQRHLSSGPYQTYGEQEIIGVNCTL